MKRVFKLLTFIFAAVAIIYMLPSLKTKAAYVTVLGPSKDECMEDYKLTIGEELDLNYYGVRMYRHKTDAETVNWTSSDSSVATVSDTGVVIAKSVGVTIVKLTLSTAEDGKNYAGSVAIMVSSGSSTGNPTPTPTKKVTATPTKKVTPTPTKKVTATPTKKVTPTPTKKATATPTKKPTATPTRIPAVDSPEINLVAYDLATLTYPTEAQAAAAVKKGITANRIYILSTGKTKEVKFVVNASVDKDDPCVVNIASTFTNGATYRITAQGLPAADSEFVAAWGEPDTAILEYTTAYLTKPGQTDITGGTTLANGSAKANFMLLDEDGIIIGQSDADGKFQCCSDIAGSKVTYTRTTISNSGSLTNSTTGAIRFSNLDQSIIITATWTSSDRKTTVKSEPVTVYPEEYVAPFLGDFVTRLTLTDLSGNNIKWDEYPEGTAEISVGETKSFAYYFTASDGLKYSQASVVTSASDVNRLSSKYKLSYIVDDDTQNCISLANSTGKVTGYREGVVTIYLVLDGVFNGTSYASEVVGELELTVKEKAKPSSIDFSDYFPVGYLSDSTKEFVVNFTIYDQYNHKIAVTNKSQFSITEGSISWNADGYSGKIRIPYPSSERIGREVQVKYNGEWFGSLWYDLYD